LQGKEWNGIAIPDTTNYETLFIECSYDLERAELRVQDYKTVIDTQRVQLIDYRCITDTLEKQKQELKDTVKVKENKIITAENKSKKKTTVIVSSGILNIVLFLLLLL
jgi:hypothetical protein